MDNQKRIILAVLISMSAIFVYSHVINKLYPPVNKDVIMDSSVQDAPLPVVKPAPLETKEAFKEELAQPVADVELVTDSVVYGFSSLGAKLQSATFKKFNYTVPAKYLVGFPQWSDLKFKAVQDPDQLTFTFKDSNKGIQIVYKMSDSTPFTLAVNVKITSVTDSNNTIYTIASLYEAEKNSFDERFKEVSVYYQDKSFFRQNMAKFKPEISKNFSDTIQWVGFRDKFFAYIIKPVDLAGDFIVERTKELDHKLSFVRTGNVNAYNKDILDNYLIFMGPQESNALSAAGASFEAIRYYGKLDPLVKLFLSFMDFLFRTTGNVGISIILLSIALNAALFPLSRLQMQSMKRMQDVQPEINAIKDKYKDNNQKQHQEIIQLMRNKRANPAEGCIWLLIQAPVFFAVFIALYRFIYIKGATFLWVKDLAEPDRFMTISGFDINLLPIFMSVVMMFQQKISMTKMAGSQSEQQKMSAWIFALVFGFFFYKMPAALVLYWTINSLLMMVMQWKALK